ncbi:aaa family ATPase, putative [Leishmania tarentolae]|uniref:Aaa family ATPase, putative n=1 Tax=Leishmania tarentolae TaxID=5689 RepID=A0A640KB46_LEITA|nr:aaa family ATPase, putative [Leishmania tarentolae]
MPPRKKSGTAATKSSTGAPAESLQETLPPTTAAASQPLTSKPSPLSCEVATAGTATASRCTTPARTAAATVSHVRAFYRTGQFSAAPPHTLMDLLRFCVECFLLCVVPSLPHRSSTAAAVAGAKNASSLTSGSSAGCNGNHTTAAAAKPAAVDVAAQVTTLTFISVPNCVRPFFEGVTLLRTDGEMAAAAAGNAIGRKRHRGAVEHNEALSMAAGDPLVEDGESTDSPYQLDVMLQRLREYGEVHVPGFESDSAYLAAKDVLVYLKNYANLVSGMALSAAILRSIELVGLDFRQQCVPCMAAVTQLVRHLINAQLRTMQLLPRVVRLSERLRLSAKAACTLEYLLVCHCGRYAPGNIAEPLRPANIAYHNELTPQELLSILSESGVLWKQGLIFSDIKMRTTFMECKYALSMETIAALSGDQLSEEQLIKLERTALLEVLNEERNAKVTSIAVAAPAPRTEEHVSGSRSVSPSPKLGEEEGDVDDEEEDDDSAADSALTLTEEALDHVLEEVGPAVMASKDPEAIYEAVSKRLNKVLARTTATPLGGCAVEAEPAAKNSAAAATAEAVRNGKINREESAMVTLSPAPPMVPPSHAAGTASRPESGGDATTATCTPRRARLALADINPLAQRYRCTTTGTTAAAALPSSSATPHTDSSMRGVPYESDIEYMDAAFRILANMIRIRYAEGDMKDEEDSYTPKSKVEASIRELKGKVRVAASVHESRLHATLAAQTFTPRIEQLARRLQLTEMEKQIMLFMVGNVVSHDMLVAVNGRYVMRDGQRLITVGYMLFVLCESLEERVVARRAFYQSSPLVSHGVLSLTLDTVGRSCFNTDLMDYLVDIDRKIVDDVMGITAETAEMVPGSQLYFPEVELANVVLPTSTMDRVLSTIEHYSLFEQCKKSSGFGDGLGTSKGGLVMLFHGPSGTGKTMLANAVAHHLKKKILLVSVSQFRSSTKAEADALRFLFREAKLNDAILFFDECESLFEDRTSNGTVTALLSEFERYDSLIILATNRAQNFDEAMNRRISLMMEFRPPDHQLRLRIWRSHIPKQLSMDEDVCLEKLALNYELSGGLIRNAVLAALSRAVAREKSASPKLTMSDLDEGARLQLRGFFLAAEPPEGMSEFYLTPKRTLAELVVEPNLAKKLEGIASSAKSRSTLYTEWGFSEDANDDCGALYLFQGVSGTGKSLAAEGIAYECGATIRLCNVGELLLREEMRVHVVFEEGRRLGAIIVFDEAQVLFNESPKSLQLSQLIQYHARRYPRPVIVIATTVNRDGCGGRHLFSTTNINSRSSCMLFQAELTFALPRRPLREQLWRKAFPERVPTSSDVNYSRLSATSISPKLIRTIAFNVCCTAALLPVSERVVTMAMIEAEMERTVTRERSAVSASAMFA